MKSVRVIAPAKINWTLEVLGKRDDGYHEIRSVMQTIFPWDSVVLEAADDVTLSVRGSTRRLRDEPPKVRRRAREIETPESNLAYRSAMVLRERTGYRGGVTIQLDKHIPITAGLGGGSSDAAAVLRGLRRLWSVGVSDDDLMQIGAELGSDVPFFIKGGTALVSGRGEEVEQLPDVPQQEIVIRPPRWVATDDKTARMYAALGPDHFTDGLGSEQLAARIRGNMGVRDEDIVNVFERVLREVDPKGGAVFSEALSLGAGTPHLCGSGPSFFFLRDVAPEFWMWREESLLKRRELGAIELAHTLSSRDALTIGHG